MARPQGLFSNSLKFKDFENITNSLILDKKKETHQLVRNLNKEIMCKIPNLNVGIKSLDFNMRGKFSVTLTDGREVIVPVGLFPDIKAMSTKHRNEWMILDHQYFTFEHMTRVYSILDIMNISNSAA